MQLFQKKKLQKLQKQGKIEEKYEVSNILYDNSNEPHSVASALYYQAYYKFSIGEYEECLFNCTRAEEICIKNNLFKLLTYINNLQGITYSDLGDFLTSLNYSLKAYYLTLDHPEYDYHYVIVNNLGTLFHEIDCDVKGIEYYIQAYQERREYKKEIDINDGFQILNGGTVYYDPVNGQLATGWRTINGNRYYFSDGYECQPDPDDLWVYNDQLHGRMYTGINCDGGHCYNFGNDGIARALPQNDGWSWPFPQSGEGWH